MEQPVVPGPRANVLGIAGFVVGLVSICGCLGLLSPIALILSVFGLFRPPRGWAVAGTIVSILGLCLFPVGLSSVLVGTGVVGLSALVLWLERTLSLGPDWQTGFRAVVIIAMLHMYVGRHGDLPASLDDLQLDSAMLVDGWGQPFVYAVDAQTDSFTLTTAGKDGAPGTGDDLEFRGEVRNGQLQMDDKPRRGGGGTTIPAAPTTPTAPATSAPTSPTAPTAPATPDDPAKAPSGP